MTRSYKDRLIKPMNPDAVNYLSWFYSDATNLRSWCTAIFGTDIDVNSDRFAELKNAAEKTLLELEDDLVEIKKYLNEYTS